MVNEPLSVVVVKSHGVLSSVRLKLVVPNESSAFTVKCVIKMKSLANVEFDSVADHVPSMLPVACDPDPHPARIKPILNNAIVMNLVIRENTSFSGIRSGT